MKENIVTPIQELFERAGDYGKTTMELLKLKAIDKSANVISSLAAKTVLILIVAMFLLTGSIALALWLGELLGKTYYGFLALAGFYGFIALLLLLFRNQWIKKPVSDSIIKKILQ
jgi:hypothetical protein